MKRRADLKGKYGLTEGDYAAMLKGQDGGCAICGSEKGRNGAPALAVDHCHDTGEVRGLLCMNCNQALGKFKHDPALLEGAAAYLRR